MRSCRGQKDEAEKMLADTMRMAEELVATSVQVGLQCTVHSVVLVLVWASGSYSCCDWQVLVVSIFL